MGAAKRKVKLEIRNSPRFSSFEFRVSNFQFRFLSFDLSVF